MSLTEESRAGTSAVTRLGLIDTDVHPTVLVTDPAMQRNLPERWRRHFDRYGLGNLGTEMGIPPQREFTHRLDSVDDDGLVAHDPLFTKKQLLDEYDMSGAVLFDAYALNMTHGGNNYPEELSFALTRAFNQAHGEVWFEADPRYYGVINNSIEFPQEAVKEIVRCKESEWGDRYVAVGVEARAENPIGNPKYWPVFEVAEHYGMPMTIHVSPGRRMTGSGPISYYYEWHGGLALRNYTIVSSLIFEGVFERFPNLKFSLIEQGWSWAVAFAWRLDKVWEMHRDEVPQLQRKPSEYLREHFYFATQPMEEPENLEDFHSVYASFENAVGTDRLMFSSDYPHWDFDSPYESVPPSLPLATRARIYGQNASELYGIPLIPDTGVIVEN